jgi:SAM-dependent methyltransferase
MPFPDRHFDAAIASYTLHHCANPLATLEEMTRVSRSRVVLLESWGRTRLLRLLLAAVDVAANALRGGSWNERVRYRSIPEWCALAAASGLHLVQTTDLGGLFHAKLLLEFEPLHHRTIKILPDPDDPPSPCTRATT